VSQATGARILVVDDEPAFVRAVETNLRKHDFRVERAATGEQAIEAYARVRPDLVLLDLGLPDLDGLQVIRSIRTHASTPIVVLSARGAEGDKVTALEQGADDYLTKPFGARELLARIRVALRHAAGPPRGTEPVIISGEIAVDLERRRVTLASREVHLTPTEYDLLKILVANPDKVLTDSMLVERLWGVAYRQQAHSLHVYVARLRKKLEADPQVPHYLLTEPGVGYRFVTESPSHIGI
jgi:two-component system KDP operon response regulator KdpE